MQEQIKIAKNFKNIMEQKKKKGISGEDDCLATFKEEFLQKLFPEYNFVIQPRNCKDTDKVDLCGEYDGKIVFYLEAKNYQDPLPEDTEQIVRYMKNYPNLIYTNFEDFKFLKKNHSSYDKGNQFMLYSLKEGLFDNSGLETVSLMIEQIKGYAKEPIPISSSQELAYLLAEKAKILDTLVLSKLQNKSVSTKIHEEFDLFKDNLITSLSEEEFASLYAQIIIYGLSYAKHHSIKTSKPFSLKESHENIPSIHELLKFFLKKAITDESGEISNIENDLLLVLESIVSLLNNISSNITDFDTTYFYENFLEQYNKQMKKEKGVWYTPVEIVDFMIKSADDLFKDKLGITEGICSDEKYIDSKGKSQYKVQILDPATGTGNYLRRIVQYIHTEMKEYNWELYSPSLMDRLNAFEVMVIAYTLARLNVIEEIEKTGIKKIDKLNVFLTDSLDPSENQGLFKGADNFLKKLVKENNLTQETRNKPISLVIGNPPYLAHSTNKSDFIQNLISSYGKGRIQDDYIKFIRYGQYFIDNTGFGVLTYITNNSFLMAPTMLGVRESLLKSFDEIYILNIKGENVFEIKASVCISFFVKTGKKKPHSLGKVFYRDLIGSKEEKLKYLKENTIKDISFTELPIFTKEKFFCPLEETIYEVYSDSINTFSLHDLFDVKQTGITTSCDTLVIDSNKKDLEKKIKDFIDSDKLPPNTEIKDRGNLAKKGKGEYRQICYRCYDNRFYFDSDLTSSSSLELVKQVDIKENFYISYTKTPQEKDSFSHIFISKHPIEHKIFKGGNRVYSAPFLVHVEDPMGIYGGTQIKENIDTLHITPVFKKLDSNIEAIDIIDYCYGILHDSTYITQYNEFLKLDYPRIPYPDSMDTFTYHKEIGRKLRVLHMNLTPSINTPLYKTFSGKDYTISSFKFKGNNLYINNTSYFKDVPKAVWLYKVGSFFPIKNYLNDRKGKTLSLEELGELNNVILTIKETLSILSPESLVLELVENIEEVKEEVISSPMEELFKEFI